VPKCKTGKLQIKLTPQENIIRLYLEKNDREKFSSIIHELWSFYSPTIDQAVRMKNNEALIRGMQFLFEKRVKG